jgi:hypothetical protein
MREGELVVKYETLPFSSGQEPSGVLALSLFRCNH